MEEKMTPQKIKSLPVWRIDNLYPFFGTVIAFIFTVASMYFAIINTQNLQNQKLEYISTQLDEIRQTMKERQALGDATRNRVSILETKVDEILSRK